MARIVFTAQLRRFVETPEVETTASTVREALEQVFQQHPRLRGYILDDQGHLRANVVVFVDRHRCEDRIGLSEAVPREATVHVLQALSGG